MDLDWLGLDCNWRGKYVGRASNLVPELKFVNQYLFSDGGYIQDRRVVNR